MAAINNVNNKLLRVSQMNALYLDNEIYKLFIQVIHDGNQFLPEGFASSVEAEIDLLVRLAILNYSVMHTGSTFGQQLLSIKYNNMTSTKKVLYLICNCLEYIRNKCEWWKPAHNINNTFFLMYTVVKLMDLINLSIFLKNGVKPTLIDRVLCLNQVYATDTARRQFESKYLTRELLWNGFIEVIINILPLINYHKLKRNVKHFNPFYQRSVCSTMSERVLTENTKCAHCGEYPILPHHMGCEHVFCYVCLKGNQTADSKYECSVCDHRNPNILCDRVTAM